MVETELMRAARAGDCQKVSKLIHEAGQQDAAGKTALMYAAEHGHLECVNALKKTAEHLMHDARGWTGLMYACANSHADCAAALVEECQFVDHNTVPPKLSTVDYEAELAARNVYEAELREELEVQNQRMLKLQKVYDQMSSS